MSDKSVIIFCLMIIAAVFFLPQKASAEDVNSTLNLDQLLDAARQSSKADSQVNREREARFLQQKNKQKSALKNSRSELKKTEKLAKTLETTFDNNEETIQKKKILLEQRLGNLKELFGHLTASAGDMRSSIDVSLISAQYPERDQQLDHLIDKMNNAALLPEVQEIEALWIEMLREMTESSRVVKFDSDVISPNGETTSRPIVRIGSFNLVSEDKYLSYSPESGTVNELSRQPSVSFLSALPVLFTDVQNFSQIGIDPTGPSGGSFLAALVDSPNLIERWHQGGIVGYVISAIGILAALIVVWRLLALWFVELKVLKLLNRKVIDDQLKTNNPLGRVLAIHKNNPQLDADTLEAKLSEAIIKERPTIEKFLPLLKIVAMVAPLLGLLGTVAGMIITFQAITIFGAGDPKAMAGGISSALVTTVLGLLVAIPTVFAHSVLNGKAQKILHILEHQSMGLIALHTNRQQIDEAAEEVVNG